MFTKTFAQGIEAGSGYLDKTLRNTIKNIAAPMPSLPIAIQPSDIIQKQKLEKPGHTINVTINNPISRSDKEDIIRTLRKISYLLPV
jgi:hypothetical protein